MAIAYVQSAIANSNACAFDTDNTAGNLLVVPIGSAGNITGVTDTRSNTHAKAVDEDLGGTDIYTDIWYAMNCAAGANTVTLSGGFGSFENIAVAEYSGVATTSALDKTAAAKDATGIDLTPSSGSTATTAQADELLIGAIGNESSRTTVWDAPWTEREDTPAGSRVVTYADQIVSATGTYAATGTVSAGCKWVALIATFLAAGGGGGTAVPVFDHHYRMMRAG